MGPPTGTWMAVITGRGRWAAAAMLAAAFGIGSALHWGGATNARWAADLGEIGAALVASCASLVGRARAKRARDVALAAAWGWVSMGVMCWAVGELLWGLNELVLGRETPFPSLADAGYLAGYPLLLIGLARFPAEAGRVSRVRAVLDGALVAASLLAPSWQLVLGPMVRAHSGNGLAQLVGTAYPVGDVVLAIAALLVAQFARKDLRVGLLVLCAGLLLTCLSDTGFAMANIDSGYQSGGFLDTGWFVGYLLIGLAATVHVRAPARTFPVRLVNLLTQLTPFMTLVIGWSVMVWAWMDGQHLDRVEMLILVSTGVALLARQALMVVEHSSLTRTLAGRDHVFRSLVQGSTDVMGLLDKFGVVRYHSPAIERVLGYRADSLVGQQVVDLIHEEDREAVRRAFVTALGRDMSLESTAMVECRMVHVDGTFRHVEVFLADHRANQAVRGFVVNARDITERNDLQHHLSQLAFRDPLTGLANRSLFRERLEAALAVRDRQRVSLLYVDLDGFKAVNDSLGHAAGDALLVDATERLRQMLRGGTLVARLGGDEFAVLLTTSPEQGGVRAVAERVLEALSHPYLLAGREVVITASVGIAHAMVGDTAEELLRNADLAMYAAKGAAKGSCAEYVPAMHAAVLARLELEGDLRSALAEGGLDLVYQPMVDLGSGRFVGVEALVRWVHPMRGFVPPAEFVPVAEDTGLIVPLGRWILDQACARLAAWRLAGHSLDLSVNLSVRQLQSPGIVESVRDTLRRHGLPAEVLTLEITESVLVDADRLVGRLEMLRDLGVRLAIDDFGTGFSSLGYLRLLPVTSVKIDRSFTAGLGKAADLSALTTTVVRLGHDLGLTLVAEGIETESQLRHLQSVGCHQGQGFLFAPPLAGTAIDGLLLDPAAFATLVGLPLCATPPPRVAGDLAEVGKIASG